MSSIKWANAQLEEIMSRVNDYAEQNGGEISGELVAELEESEGIKEDAIDEMAISYKSLCTKAEMIKVQEKALSMLRKEQEAEAETIRRSIGFILMGDKFTSASSKISYRKSSAVSVYDENVIPAEFWITKETVSISKADLKKALKDGTVEGAVMESKISVVIK